MKEKIDNLVTRFNALNCVNTLVSSLRANPEFIAIVNELKVLMKDEEFFELLLNEPFKVDSIHFDSSSPLMPLLSAVYYTLIAPTKSKTQLKIVFNLLLCEKNQWEPTCLEEDRVISELLEKTDNYFMGTFRIHLGYEHDQGLYTDIVKKMKESPDNTSALLRLTDNRYAESVFLLKFEGRVIALINNHVHRFTQDLFSSSDLLHCAQMEVIHDGNCSVYSELNINAALYASLKEQSVSKTLIALKDKQLDLRTMRLKPEELNPIHMGTITSADLARWFAKAGKLFVDLDAEGWLKYCNKRSINPLSNIKVDYQNWPVDQYKKIKMTLDLTDADEGKFIVTQSLYNYCGPKDSPHELSKKKINAFNPSSLNSTQHPTPVQNEPEQIQQVEPNQHQPEPPKNEQKHKTDSKKTASKGPITMMVLGGFIALLGITAVALAFTVLNIATMGTAALVAFGLGTAVALGGGIGLFSAGLHKNRKDTPDETNEGLKARL